MGSLLGVFEAVSNVALSWIGSLFVFCVWPLRGSRGGGECCVGVRKAAGPATRDDPARDDTYRGSYFGMRRSSSLTSLISVSFSCLCKKRLV